MYSKLAFGNVKKSFRSYGVYFLTLFLGVCMFYAFNSIDALGTLAEQSSGYTFSEEQNKLLDLLNLIIGGVSVFITVVMGFLIVYANLFLIRRRKQEFGIYLLLGMPPAKVSRVIVYETLMVGTLSLATGLVAGILLSQMLLYVTAGFFSVALDTFTVAVSWKALISTIVYFGAVFIVALLFNALTVSRYKLIDLINARRKSEHFKLRGMLLSTLLLLASLILIGVAYALLRENGLRYFDDLFLSSTILVCVGTLLFFFSLAGCLLKAVQSRKNLYLKGLRMFTLRQLGARVNTAFISITLVCLALFLAITISSGGIAMYIDLTENLDTGTRYDATLSASYREYTATDADPPWLLHALADDYDMEAALKRDVQDWDTLVKAANQVDFYETELSYQDVSDVSGVAIEGDLFTSNPEEVKVMTTTLSAMNGQRALLGLEPLTMQNDEYLIWSDISGFELFLQTILNQEQELTVLGTTLHPATQEIETLPAETTGRGASVTTLVIADEVLPPELAPTQSKLNIMYNGERDEIESQFLAALDTTYEERWELDTTLKGWPYIYEFTAEQAFIQSQGLSIIVSYLAIYLGFILVITCAAILALQQLSDAADNGARFALLQKLGVEKGMMSRALFIQIGVYFILPLVLALCHSWVALSVLVDVLSDTVNLDIVTSLMLVVCVFLVIYGGYFLLTFFASRNIIASTRLQTML